MSSRTHVSRPQSAALATPSLHTQTHLAPVVRAGTASGGQSLDRKTQNEMSAKFGHDFSQIRIHTDSRAEDSASAMGANAFALGSDIVFGGGRYTPGSPHTERLLAHELTHVVQQSQWGQGDWGRTSARGDASEREADSLASQVMLGRSVQVQAAPGAAVARDENDLMCSPEHPDPVPVSDSSEGGIPQLSTPVNDTLGTGLAMCGMVPGPVGQVCTVAGGIQSATQGPSADDPDYAMNRGLQGVGVVGALAGLAGVEAAGPIGLGVAGATAAGHGAQWLGEKMIEGGQQSNPGQFGPDPMDGLNSGQAY